MAIKVETVDDLKEYFTGVATRANHHSPQVRDIIYSLLGIVILKKDIGTDIEVRGSNTTGNILWVTINGIRYAFRYEHSDQTVEIRKDSYAGPIILKVDNATTIQNILSVF